MKTTQFIRKLAILTALLMLAVLTLASCSYADALISKVGEVKDSILGMLSPDEDAPKKEQEEQEQGPEAQQPSGNTPGGATGNPEETVKPGDTITVAKALAIADEVDESGRYYIEGTVKSVTNATYGAMIIEDATGEISVYNSKNADGTVGYAEMSDKPYKGDSVRLYCTLHTHNGEPEVKSAYIISFTHAEFDESSYTAASIAEARAAAKGDKLKVDGVVARITYANGMVPSGFILIDEGASIYVYDGDAAARVSVGNRIEIAASKDYWILDKEQTAAAKFGYLGCNQLTDVNLLSNDGGNSAYDTSWIESSTVKAIMDTPVTEDITSKVYKVNALVKKVPASNFVNYYFFDLDGESGNYTYTQCNGSDFAWLDTFDGKICTVYLTALNAKSSSNDCFWRLLPVTVIDEGFVFDKNDAAEFAVKYHGLTSIDSGYMVGASHNVTTLVNSELLGLEDVTITYSSSNTEVLSFTVVEGSTVLTTLAPGAATVTVTSIYNGKEYSQSVNVTVKSAELVSAITVPQAIASALDSVITVAGKVGPSTVNQYGGFYLIDESGSIPVKLAVSDAIKGLKIGDEVIIKGTRSLSKDGGQIVIYDAEILANFYGGGTYSTSSFITDKEISDIKAVADSTEATTQVYTVTAKVAKTSVTYGSYTNTTYNVGGIQLYSGGASQYSWLDAFFAEGTTEATLTVELALCDWNAKGLKGCVLAVITADGKVYNEINFNAD